MKTKDRLMLSEIDLNRIPFPSSENWKFIDELKKERQRYFAWTRQTAVPGEADFSLGCVLTGHFPDPEGGLATALDDWKNFLHEAGLPESGPYKVVFRQGNAGPYDSFRLTISADECIITAGNREGIRRGIFYLEDLLLASDGPFLKV